MKRKYEMLWISNISTIHPCIHPSQGGKFQDRLREPDIKERDWPD